MNTFAKFKVNLTETVGVAEQAFLSQIRGNNSVIVDGIFTKCVSCTSTAPNEHFCQVSSGLD